MNLKTFYIGMTIMAITTASLARSQTVKKLPMCAKSPNCVSSQATDSSHYVAPLRLTVNPRQAWAELKKNLEKLPRIRMINITDVSLHAEATSLLFRFVDDIHAVLDENANVIHIRSASRTGYSDFGVNRKRVEVLRFKLQQAKVIE